MKKHVLAAAVLAFAAGGALAQAGDTLAKIKAGAVTMGVRDSSGGLAYDTGTASNPVGLGNPASKYGGFHTELARLILADVAKQQGVANLKINEQLVTSQNRIPLLVNGTVDLECGSTTNNETRKKDVAFLHTTYVEEVRMAVKADSGINSVGDLKGKTVVTTTGTTSVQTLRKNKRAENIEFKDIQGKDHADSFLLLETGRADAFVMDGQILAGNIAKAREPSKFKIVGEPLSVEPIACMVRKDDEAFRKAANASIERQIKDGSLAKLYDKWFMQPIAPTNTKIGLAISPATKDAWANPNDRPMEAYAAK